MDNAAIVGFGMVGNATSTLFGIKKHFDIDATKSNTNLQEVSKCRFVFMCLPTPVKEQGDYDVSAIIQMIKEIENYGGGSIYIIRSTVFPGFALSLQKELGINRIISNPEFLSESTWEKDVKYPPFVLLGGLQGVFLEDVKALYQARIKSAPIIVTDNTTAEMAKLAINGYFATKVIFANQIYDSCQKFGVNYETVKQVLEKHPFGPKNHFTIWYKGKRGVNGKCLPKDSRALAYYTQLDLIKEIVALNEQYIYQKS